MTSLTKGNDVLQEVSSGVDLFFRTGAGRIIEEKKKKKCKERKSGYIFTESLSIIPTGKVEVAVQMEVVGRELGHSHDGLLAVVSDLVNLVLLLCFLY